MLVLILLCVVGIRFADGSDPVSIAAAGRHFRLGVSCDKDGEQMVLGMGYWSYKQLQKLNHFGVDVKLECIFLMDILK